MEKISKGFAGRTFRAVLFIILVILFCTAISSAGIFLASRYGLTRSREQVPLTALSIGPEEDVELPRRGRMVEGDGWRLRNSRDIYTLTLDNAIIEGSGAPQGSGAPRGSGAPQGSGSRPAITVTGDLIIELKEGSGNWIRSEGSGICIRSGTLVIGGKGSLTVEAGDTGIVCGGRNGGSAAAVRLEDGQLDIRGRYAGIRCPVVELAGSSGSVTADPRAGADAGTNAPGVPGIGINAVSFKAEASTGELVVQGHGAALIAADPVSGKPSLQTDKKVSVMPADAQVREFRNLYPYEDGDEARVEICNIVTYSSGEAVTYNDSTSIFDGSVKEITFCGE